MKTGVDKRFTVLLIRLVTIRTKISLILKVTALADTNIFFISAPVFNLLCLCHPSVQVRFFVIFISIHVSATVPFICITIKAFHLYIHN